MMSILAILYSQLNKSRIKLFPSNNFISLIGLTLETSNVKSLSNHKTTNFWGKFVFCSLLTQVYGMIKTVL